MTLPNSAKAAFQPLDRARHHRDTGLVDADIADANSFAGRSAVTAPASPTARTPGRIAQRLGPEVGRARREGVTVQAQILAANTIMNGRRSRGPNVQNGWRTNPLRGRARGQIEEWHLSSWLD